MAPCALCLLCRFIFFFVLSGNGVVAVPTPGVAAADALDAQPQAFDDTPLFNGLDHVVRASRLIAAVRAQQRRDDKLIKADGQRYYFPQNFFHTIGTNNAKKCYLCKQILFRPILNYDLQEPVAV